MPEPSDTENPREVPDSGPRGNAVTAGFGGGSQVLSASLTFALAVAGMTLVGHWLDGRLGTTPLFLLAGALWAFAAGFIYLLKQLAPAALPSWMGGAGSDDKNRDAE